MISKEKLGIGSKRDVAPPQHTTSRPTAEMLAQRDERRGYEPTIGTELLGDPPTGRSALALRKEKAEQHVPFKFNPWGEDDAWDERCRAGVTASRKYSEEQRIIAAMQRAASTPGVCPACGQRFEPKKASHIFCSRECNGRGGETRALCPHNHASVRRWWGRVTTAPPPENCCCMS
jgi:hypothetical protein